MTPREKRIKSRLKAEKKEKVNYWLFFRWPVYIVVSILVLFFISSPLRAKLSNGYVAKGDDLLEQKKYLSAELQYRKAIIIKKNAKAQERIGLSNKAQTNVLELEIFYAERDNLDQLNLFSKAKEVPTNAKDAVVLSQDLIKSGEYQLAIVAADTALQMDPGYDIAKEYFLIANKETVNSIELSPDAQKYYDSK
jgi:tetratricopeptide (TPR) repeat protein